MLTPIVAYMVTKGIYAHYQVSAVFTERLGAQEFANHHNLTRDRYSKNDRAMVEQVDLYGLGWRRPSMEVGDREVITVADEPRSTSAPLHPQGAISTAPRRTQRQMEEGSSGHQRIDRAACDGDGAGFYLGRWHAETFRAKAEMKRAWAGRNGYRRRDR